MIPNLKYFFFSGGGGGLEYLDFFTKNPNMFFWGGMWVWLGDAGVGRGGDGGRGRWIDRRTGPNQFAPLGGMAGG